MFQIYPLAAVAINVRSHVAWIRRASSSYDRETMEATTHARGTARQHRYG